MIISHLQHGQSNTVLTAHWPDIVSVRCFFLHPYHLLREHLSVESEWAGVANQNLDCLTDQTFCAVEDDDVIRHAPTRELSYWSCYSLPMPARAFHQDLDGLAHLCAVVRAAVLGLNGEEIVVSPLFHFIRHIVGVVVRCLGSRPLAVLEDERVLELRATYQVNGFLKAL